MLMAILKIIVCANAEPMPNAANVPRAIKGSHFYRGRRCAERKAGPSAHPRSGRNF